MKPILFNQEMVQAILEGRKTQTRRIMKPQPKADCHSDYENAEWKNEPPSYYDTGNNNWVCKYCGHGIGMDGRSIFHAPYQVGDILYARETFSPCKIKKPIKAIPKDFKEVAYYYKADGVANSDGSVIKWHPSIHMPKEAARIFLKVTDVRVQRIQDINSHEAYCDGISNILDEGHPLRKKAYEKGFYDKKTQDWYAGTIEAFAALWDSTVNKKDIDKYGWDANPYVWVISFERTEKP